MKKQYMLALSMFAVFLFAMPVNAYDTSVIMVEGDFYSTSALQYPVEISAEIDGAIYGTAVVEEGNHYFIDMAADNEVTPLLKEGGAPGDVVHFFVNGQEAEETLLLENFDSDPWLAFLDLNVLPEPPERAKIYVIVFHDLDGDGVMDEGESLLANWTVVLNNSFGEASATTSEGWIYFEADPAEISATITPPEGNWRNWLSTTKKTVTFSVVAGETYNLAFGVQNKNDCIAQGNAYGHDKEKKPKK